MEGLSEAVRWGAAGVVDIILEKMDPSLLSQPVLQELLVEAVMSDSPQTLSSIRSLCQSEPPEVVNRARQRGVAGVGTGLGEDEEEGKETMKCAIMEGKEAMKCAIMEGKASILERVPKSTEMTYSNSISQLLPLLLPASSITQSVPFSLLLEHLLQPQVHTIYIPR